LWERQHTEPGQVADPDQRLPPPMETLFDVPDEVLMFCAKESEEWARAELLSKAQRLYYEQGDEADWDSVLRILSGEEETAA